jgi:uncharacterized membrane protein
MEYQPRPQGQKRVAIRLIVAVVVGFAVTLELGFTTGLRYSLAVGWIAAACVYLAWTWKVVLPMDADETRRQVGPEDPPRGWITDGIILTACVASLAGVAHLLAAGSRAGVEKQVAASVGVLSILAAWCVVHTVFSTRYADIYYSNGGRGINFNGKENPRFLDFFYFGFTVGMTYQVSDTSVETGQLRRIVLCQALLSYFFGAVILAVMINLVVGLGNSVG